VPVVFPTPERTTVEQEARKLKRRMSAKARRERKRLANPPGRAQVKGPPMTTYLCEHPADIRGRQRPGTCDNWATKRSPDGLVACPTHYRRSLRRHKRRQTGDNG